MSSSRKPSMASANMTDKRTSQWEELMRKFSEAHKEQFKASELDIPRAERSAKFFPTGSKYEGSWDVLGMSGYGVYTFPSGVVYEGNFEDGMFHGKGQLRYENGIIVRGNFVKGILTERTLQGENTEYSENEWMYCKMPDRRFEIEYETGLKPAGNANLTAVLPTREIPPGHYDTGDGFYDPKTKVIYKYNDMSAIMRSPTVLEQQWIVNNCRVNPMKPLGPCPDLYEEFTEPVENPEPPPPPAAGIKGEMTSFRAQSMCEDFEIKKGFGFLDIGSSLSDSSSNFSSHKEPSTIEVTSHEFPLTSEKYFGRSSCSIKLYTIPTENRDWFNIHKHSIDSELYNNSEAAVHSRDQLLLEAGRSFSNHSLDAGLSTVLDTQVTFADIEARKSSNKTNKTTLLDKH